MATNKTVLTTEQLNERIAMAKLFKLASWKGKAESVEVSISSKTAEEFGYADMDSIGLDSPLYRKESSPDSSDMRDGYFLINLSCPVASSLEEAVEIASALLPKAGDILDVLNAKFKTEYQNKVRAFLNAPISSGKAVKQATADTILARFQAGELSATEFATAMRSLL